jgi:hypothetical protein
MKWQRSGMLTPPAGFNDENLLPKKGRTFVFVGWKNELPDSFLLGYAGRDSG